MPQAVGDVEWAGAADALSGSNNALDAVRLSFLNPVGASGADVMKTLVRILFIALGLRAVQTPGQVYNILHSFGSASRDGSAPLTGLVLSGDTLYGTTTGGGTNAGGTIFKIRTDGTGYSVLHSFKYGPRPDGGMVLIGNALYGTTFTGGAAYSGSVFKINTDGSDFIDLHSFSATVPLLWGTNSDGNRPRGELVTDGNTLYGTTQFGGTAGNGTVFRINTDG